MSGDPGLRSEPRPESLAEGTLLLWLYGTLAAFGVFLVLVPGVQGGQVGYLLAGALLALAAGLALVRAVRARIAHLRSIRPPAPPTGG